MNGKNQRNAFFRLAGFLIAAVALPILALAPALFASQFIDQPSIANDAISHATTVAYPYSERETMVAYNPSIRNQSPIGTPWHTSDVIRNGVLVREDFVRPRGLDGVARSDNLTSRILPADGDECATILRLLEDEIDDQPSGWYLVYVEVADYRSGTLRRCTIPRADASG